MPNKDGTGPVGGGGPSAGRGKGPCGKGGKSGNKKTSKKRRNNK